MVRSACRAVAVRVAAAIMMAIVVLMCADGSGPAAWAAAPHDAAAAEEALGAVGEMPHGAVPVHAGPHLDGVDLTLFWVIPFAGILLSIALFRLAMPHF